MALAAWPELFKHRNTGMPMITRALGINFRKDNGELDARAAAEIVIKASKHTGLGIEELLGKTGAKTENSPIQEELRTVDQVDPEEEARAEAAEEKARAEAAEAKARAEAAEAKARAEAAEAKARAEAAEAKARAEAPEAKARAEAAEAKARAEAAEAKGQGRSPQRPKARAEAAEEKARAEAAEEKARAAGTGPHRRQHPAEPEAEKPPNSEWEEKLLAIIGIEETGGFLNKTVAQGGLDSFIGYWAREIRSSRHGTSEICPWLLSMKYRHMSAAGRSHYVNLMRRMLTGEQPEPEKQDAAPGPETRGTRPREARDPAAGNTGARENRNQEQPPAAAQPPAEDARQEEMNKRELIAAMCIAELAGQRIEKEEAAQEAVEYADELLRALRQPPTPGNSGRETPPPWRQG